MLNNSRATKVSHIPIIINPCSVSYYIETSSVNTFSIEKEDTVAKCSFKWNSYFLSTRMNIFSSQMLNFQ